MNTCKCGKPSNPKSTKGYCADCMKEARRNWVAMISAKSAERDERNTAFALLIERAMQAGELAANACVPTPMVVQEHANPLDDASAVKRSWYVGDGVCGFAWITVYPGNCALSNYLKKHHGARKAYQGGMQVWVSAYGQSMQRKEAYAFAYAKVLQDDGHKAYAGSRMD